MPLRISLNRSGSPRVPSGKKITMLPASSAADTPASGSSPAARPPRVTGMIPIRFRENHASGPLFRK